MGTRLSSRTRLSLFVISGALTMFSFIYSAAYFIQDPEAFATPGQTALAFGPIIAAMAILAVAMLKR